MIYAIILGLTFIQVIFVALCAVGYIAGRIRRVVPVQRK